MASIFDKNKKEAYIFKKYPEFPSSINGVTGQYDTSFLDKTNFASVEIVKKDDNYLYKIPYHANYDNNRYNIGRNVITAFNGSFSNGNRPINLSSYFNYLNENQGWATLFDFTQQNRNWNNFVNFEGTTDWPTQYGSSYRFFASPRYINLNKTEDLNDIIKPTIITNGSTYKDYLSFSNDNNACTLKVHTPDNFRLGYKMVISGEGLSDYIKNITASNLYEQFLMIGIKGGNRSTEPHSSTTREDSRVKFYGIGNVDTTNYSDLKLNYKEIKNNVWCLSDDNFSTYNSNDKTTSLTDNYIAIAQPTIYFCNSPWSCLCSTNKGFVVTALYNNSVPAIYTGSTANYDTNGWNTTQTDYYNGTYFVNRSDADAICSAASRDTPKIGNVGFSKLNNIVQWDGPGYDKQMNNNNIRVLDLVYTIYPSS